MVDFNYKVEVKAENGEMKITKTLGRDLVKAIMRARGIGDEMFTCDENIFRKTKTIIEEYTGVILSELQECICMFESCKRNAEMNGLVLNVGDYDEIDFVELFYYPVLYLVDDKDRNLFLNVLYAPRKDVDDCMCAVERMIPETCIEQLRCILDTIKSVYGDNNNFAVLMALESLINRSCSKVLNTYILTDKSGLYKIGRSENVAKRVSIFKCGNSTIRKVR